MTIISEKSLTLPVRASLFMPHKPPMLMVDKIISINDRDKSSVIESVVTHDWLFLDSDGKLDREAHMEIMAQAAAAQHGYNLASGGKQEERGFIVGIKRFSVRGDAFADDILSVNVELGPEIESLSVVYGKIFRDGSELSSAELTVWHGTV